MLHRFALLTGILIGLGWLTQLKAGDLVTASVDQVKVEAIDSSRRPFEKVVATKLLKGDEAKPLIAGWNSLQLLSAETDCVPQPAYRLSFYTRDGHLFRIFAICFDCHTLFSLKPEKPDDINSKEIVFKDDGNARHLRKTLAALFPGHDPASR